MAVNIEERMIAVPGGRVWSQRVGGASSAPPLLVLHGGPGAPHDYLEPLAALSPRRPVIFYDQLGCGRSEQLVDASLCKIERFVAEVEAVRQAWGLKRLHLLGQSWGALLALEYSAASDGSGVASLVLSAPLISTARWQADQRRYLAAMPEEVQQAVREAESSGDFQAPAYQAAMMAYYRRHVCRMEPWPDCLNRTMAKMALDVYLTMWGPSEFICTGSLRSAERADLLPHITQPMLLTCGRYDEAAPETVAWFASLAGVSELRIFEEASHEHHLEQTPAYLTAVDGFLAQHE